MSEDLSSYLNYAEDELAAGRELVRLGFHRGAVSNAYYSMFWAVRGLLAEREVFAKTHHGVHSKFGRLFIKTEEVPVAYSDLLKKLSSERQVADYELTGDFSEEEVAGYLLEVEEF
jgi:hypothetical protein